ncbi:MAG TPA: hypothetical protein VMW48_14000 [Vicinamibacterales bacterium]|nr:hypothetical protein [Vicinamibacterales bacterium]
MDGTKLARIRRCHICEHRVTQHAGTGASKFTVYCVAEGEWDRRATLDDARMEGPEGNCPLGLWRNLTPVDIPSERAANLATAIARDVERWKAVLDDMLPGQYLAIEIRARLTKMVAAGRMRPDVATALEGHILARR